MSYDSASAGSLILRFGSSNISMGWFRMLSFVSDNMQMRFSANTTDYAVITGDGTFGASGDLGLAVTGAPSGYQTFYSGSYPGWVFVCVVTTSGVGTKVYWRKEGDVVLQSATQSDSTNSGVNAWELLDSFLSNTVHQRCSAYKEWASPTALTSTQIFNESTQKAPIVTLGLANYLSCDLGSTVGQDQSGNASDWTINGTVTTNADEPNMSVGIVYDRTLSTDTIALTDSGLVECQKGDDLKVTDSLVNAGLFFDVLGGYRRWLSFD